MMKMNIDKLMILTLTLCCIAKYQPAFLTLKGSVVDYSRILIFRRASLIKQFETYQIILRKTSRNRKKIKHLAKLDSIIYKKSILMQRFITLVCQPNMKKILFTLLAFATFSCTKENQDKEGNFKSDLMFHSVSLVTEGAVNGEIKARATVVGPNLCYSFTHFEVSNSKQNHFDIYAKGTVPAPEQICAQALYKKDTTVSITKPAPGTYTLNFWNPDNQIFKSETVIVN